MFHESPPRARFRGFASPALALVVFAFGGWIGARMLEAPDAPSQPSPARAQAPAPASSPAPAYAVLLSPSYSLGAAPATFAAGAPRAAAWERAAPTQVAPEAPPVPAVAPAPTPLEEAAPAVTPTPPARPADLAAPALVQPLRAAARAEQRARTIVARAIVRTPAEAAPQQEPTFFEKLFGGARASGPALAYAPREGGVLDTGRNLTGVVGPAARYDRHTAVYDISARTVHLPDGTKLEAHSGLGPRMDDPRHVHVRMHGATPPHMYNLRLREAPFHGVRAIRLLPVGGARAIFGRAGLLAHTYMLGPSGQSNGCVSLRDYNAFLRAFESGQIRRLAVVASL